MEATYKVSFYYKKLKLTVNKLPSNIVGRAEPVLVVYVASS